MRTGRDRHSWGTLLAVLLWGLAGGGAGRSEGEISTRLWVRLVDEAGRPVAARVYLRGEDGTSHTPQASLSRQTPKGESYFHADGRFQIELPAGHYTLEAVKGFEYFPARKEVDLRFLELQDRTVSETLILRRMMDLPSLGWFSGDVHMHPNHRIGGLYISMEDALLVAAGEDIRVANLLISNRQGTSTVFDTEFFRDGEVDPVSTEESLLVVQEEFRNTSGMYGHMILLGIRRLVQPFFTGLRPHWEDYPDNYTIARQVQEQGGVVSYAHPADEPEIPGGLHLAREFPIDLALGVVDGLDLLSNKSEEAACWMYYRVLNCGLRCTASAGTDSQMDVLRHSMPGGGKVYVQLSPPLSYGKWIEGFRAGRTFVSNGPLLFLQVEGKGPGEEIRLQRPQTVRVSAEAHSLVPMQVLELVVNGEVVARAEASGDGTRLSLQHPLPLSQSAWIAARVWGEGHRLVVNDPRLFAHTSPVYCFLQDRPIASREDAALLVRWIDRLLEDVERSPRFSSPERRQEVLERFRQGRRYYERMASPPP